MRVNVSYFPRKMESFVKLMDSVTHQRQQLSFWAYQVWIYKTGNQVLLDTVFTRRNLVWQHKVEWLLNAASRFTWTKIARNLEFSLLQNCSAIAPKKQSSTDRFSPLFWIVSSFGINLVPIIARLWSHSLRTQTCLRLPLHSAGVSGSAYALFPPWQELLMNIWLLRLDSVRNQSKNFSILLQW